MDILFCIKLDAKAKKLENDGVKLLFFKPEDLDIKDIWLFITSREDYGENLWSDIFF